MTVQTKTTYPPTLEKLVETIEGLSHPSPDLVAKTVASIQVQPKDLIEYADFDHPATDSYGRKLVHESEHFEVMVMSWNPGDFSVVHNHGHTEWGAVQVFGNAQHNIYFDHHHHLSFGKQEILHPNQVVKVTHQLIHQMGNPTTDRFLSLHIYGSNQPLDCITADAKHYEVEKGRTVHTTGGAFLDLDESQVYDPNTGLTCDPDVFIYQAGLLLDRYHRAGDRSHKAAELAAELAQQFA